ncbi:SRPBCC family protein [Streptomyces rhizosphaerihabitans]|uniref:SRPBCC family protein n=1 Tax=Streptomyces rhizosphaerihabitans TaxID=1266770 RepID=UPI0021BEAD97|nr:SRPBCC domain-containing protein [Streptomyces rhizosphaerihabitans]MCT9006309.1 SRPBCC domain-containing protein [Streptomyces rhizosphaerihabitans]
MTPDSQSVNPDPQDANPAPQGANPAPQGVNPDPAGPSPVSEGDLTTIRVDQFLPHPPAKVWRALTEPELLAQWQMPGSENFRLEVGHQYTLTAVPRPNSNFSGTVDVRVLAYEAQRMLSVRWADANASRPADWTITWTLEQEGRGTRLFLVHAGFDPDDPAQMMARKIMDGGWRSHVMRSLGNALDRM